MRQWLRSHLTYANVMATLAVFLVLGGGTALGAFVVSNNGQIGPNTVSGHKPFPGQHANIIPGTLSDKDLAASAVTGPKIAANAVTGAKTTDNSLTGADVASLSGADVSDNSLTGTDVNEGSLGLVPNADKLDGLDSTALVSNSDLRRVGPVTMSLPDNDLQLVTIATVGHFTFTGLCARNLGGGGHDSVDMLIGTDVDHSTFGSMSQAPSGPQEGGDMLVSGGPTFGSYDVFFDTGTATGNPVFHPASGSAVAPDGQQVVFDVYEGMNDRNQPGECIFGGTFAVK
jgi:hypothetical protein